MAEALANDMFKASGIEARAISCGVFANGGVPASKNALEAMKNGWGIDIRAHKAKMISEEGLEKADIVIAMTTGHKNHLFGTYPKFTEKIYAIKEICEEGRDIDDPFGANLDIYMQCAKQIERFLKSFDWEEGVYDCFGL